MARPFRILLAGGWYHVTARGNRRKSLFYIDRDRQGFLGLIAASPERFGLEGSKARVLMNNDHHLLARTPDPNLSQAMQWIKVSSGGGSGRSIR